MPAFFDAPENYRAMCPLSMYFLFFIQPWRQQRLRRPLPSDNSSSSPSRRQSLKIERLHLHTTKGKSSIRQLSPRPGSPAIRNFSRGAGGNPLPAPPSHSLPPSKPPSLKIDRLPHRYAVGETSKRQRRDYPGTSSIRSLSHVGQHMIRDCR